MKRIFSVILLVVYSMLLTIPYIPQMMYYAGSLFPEGKAYSIGPDNAETIIGDATYLNALIKRATDEMSSEESDKAPPPPAVDTVGLYYICSESLFSINEILPINFNFKGYEISIKETFLEIDVPPPKILS